MARKGTGRTAMPSQVMPVVGFSKANGVRELGPANEELTLLGHPVADVQDQSKHELMTAPLLTREAYLEAGFYAHVTQYGVLGSAKRIYDHNEYEIPAEERLYINTNAPFSALVCGVQGSGKSHTVAVLLESMFIPAYPAIGSLEKPLCGLVLHFGEGGKSTRPCEAAFVGRPSYARISIPTLEFTSLNVTVEPLAFSEQELDAEAFLSMMAVGSSESAPLYIQAVLSILRDLGENFTYKAFEVQLEERKKNFNPAQLAGLEQRMALLHSFMSTGRDPMQSRFLEGRLTIVDLSDPFIDSAAACGLFEIITRLFVRADVGTGKVLVVDEAHKYLDANKGNSGLTKALLSLVRQQRHLAMRVIISTQEPTVVPPVLLDLCSVAILHRFASPAWWDHIAHHVSAQLSADEAFNHVVTLQTGEAIVLAPSGLAVVKDPQAQIIDGVPGRVLSQLGRRYILMKTRRRVTKDGGGSILVL
ncbi:hypothetical protein NLI96_g1681 [Meripilus lineatus]|uniref:Zona occludens toxin N-terminal domain-containing protein n=1 Tax=Meripilus lineatus TaxID=2056292 RepID=A0AAD5VA57_9APHY|nr:hypothetical protein NLI96_g1681 [Physisporinus lineatus]